MAENQSQKKSLLVETFEHIMDIIIREIGQDPQNTALYVEAMIVGPLLKTLGTFGLSNSEMLAIYHYANTVGEMMSREVTKQISSNPLPHE